MSHDCITYLDIKNIFETQQHFSKGDAIGDYGIKVRATVKRYNGRIFGNSTQNKCLGEIRDNAKLWAVVDWSFIMMQIMCLYLLHNWWQSIVAAVQCRFPLRTHKHATFIKISKTLQNSLNYFNSMIHVP